MLINNQKRTIVHLFKDFTTIHTITSIAKELNLSRVGIWKIIAELTTIKYITAKKLGTGKTSTEIIQLQWNPILERAMALYLTEEAWVQSRWCNTFKEYEKNADFLIIYGSILHNPKQADDIDILGISKNFDKIDTITNKTQQTQIKKIHSIWFTEKELEIELKKPNKAMIDAVKTGIVLFGIDNYIKFMKKNQRT